MQELDLVEHDRVTNERRIVGKDVRHLVAIEEIRYNGIDTLHLQAMSKEGRWVDLYRVLLEDLFQDSDNLLFPIVIKLSLSGQILFGSLDARSYLHRPPPVQYKTSTL